MPNDAPSEAASTAHHQPSASHKTLRLITIASFLPAFPLCLVHGILAHSPVPAVGLVPLAFSATGGVFLLWPRASEDGRLARLSNPVLVFVCDAILAAAFMVVLVFTWIAKSYSPSLSMLAAYATIPLLINFLVHLILAVQAFYTGLAIHSLVQWLAWRTLPPDCPHCDHRLRPDLPELPWLQRLRQRRRGGYTSLFVDDEQRYRDNEDEDTVDHAVEQAESAHAVQPEAVEVRRKNSRKSKTATPPSRDETTSPWSS
ncbi:hypothetical protein FZEAL_7944 [Fusarium zealandicum]|uniref:Nucleosomal binding protein n=1 Tax=Fusarium zealandicum TaxID=1053134 RepID=A0A8H4UET6_9HYPO|nr:hypothetical protein FZEAL_7944 [Fusarium zealandicum]